jgi:capsular exopolysaccharide synthesis family protein
VGVEAFNQSVESPLEIERGLKVRSLGVVPDGKIVSKSRDLLQENTFEFVAYDNPKTVIADAIRCVHTSLVLSHSDDTVRRFVVSSALQGEGKTTVAVWLSTIFHSGSDRRTLLVDCDLRKPRLHKIFGHKETDPGLTSLFNGSNRDSTEVVRVHRIPGLFYITSGPVPSDPVAVLQSERMEHLIEEFGRMFDYLVIDSPPLLGCPDALRLSRLTDGVLLVARQGKVKREELAEAVNIVNSMDSGKLLGIILNKTRRRSNGYGYGGFSYSRYSSYYGS